MYLGSLLAEGRSLIVYSAGHLQCLLARVSGFALKLRHTLKCIKSDTLSSVIKIRAPTWYGLLRWIRLSAVPATGVVVNI